MILGATRRFTGLRGLWATNACNPGDPLSGEPGTAGRRQQVRIFATACIGDGYERGGGGLGKKHRDWPVCCFWDRSSALGERARTKNPSGPLAMGEVVQRAGWRSPSLLFSSLPACANHGSRGRGAGSFFAPVPDRGALRSAGLFCYRSARNSPSGSEVEGHERARIRAEG